MKSVLLILLLLSSAALAQTASCGITSVADGRQLVYPPIAKAAHVTGAVILLASFDMDGSVSNVSVVSGPELLKKAAVEYVKAWRVNTYGGPRTCPIVIRFRLDEGKEPGVERQDAQHVVIHAQTMCLCDPPPEIIYTRRHWYWPF